jgi:hypothetical protein
MFRNGWFVASTLVLTIALGILSTSWMTRTTAAPAPSDADQASFRGKVLLVQFNFGMGAIVLEEVKVRKFGEHAFLLGKVVESQSGTGPLKGKTVWHNMNGITQIVECENAEGAKKMLKTLPNGIGGYSSAGAGSAVPSGTTTPVAPAPQPLPNAPRPLPKP